MLKIFISRSKQKIVVALCPAKNIVNKKNPQNIYKDSLSIQFIPVNSIDMAQANPPTNPSTLLPLGKHKKFLKLGEFKRF